MPLSHLLPSRGVLAALVLGSAGLLAGCSGGDSGTVLGNLPQEVVDNAGRYVSFLSAATNLVPDDTNAKTDVFVLDRQTGEIERVSVSSSGEQANGDSLGAAISGDGRYVAFSTFASNLATGGQAAFASVYVRDRATDTTVLLSRTHDGSPIDGSSWYPTLDFFGNRIAFQSQATNLVPGDTNQSNDVFMYDRASDSLSRVSLNSAGQEADGHCNRPALSADGGTVAFDSSATNLVAMPKVSADNGQFNQIYVRNLAAATTDLVSGSPEGAYADNNCYQPSISGNGRRIVFGSYAANLVAAMTPGTFQVFLRDRDSGATSLVSVTPQGTQAANGASYQQIALDGIHASFATASSDILNPLIPERRARTEVLDIPSQVVVRNLETGVNVLASQSTLQDAGNDDSRTSRLAPDGSRVWFDSIATNLEGPTPTATALGGVLIQNIFERDLTTGVTRQAVKGMGDVQPDGRSTLGEDEA